MRFGTLKKFGDQFSQKSSGSISELLEEADKGKFSFVFPACEQADFEPLLRILRRVLSHVSRIASDPLSVLKGRLALRRAETALSFSQEGIRATLEDMRVWTYRGGEICPESVYVSENTEDPNIYENRFVKALIDRALRFLTVCIRYSKGGIRTMRMLGCAKGSLSKTDFIRLAGNKLDRSTVTGAGTDYGAFTALRKKFLRLCGTDFYKTMSGFPAFADADPEETDIFRMNNDYRECFEAWIRLDRFESAMSGLSGAERKSVYTAFVSLALVRAYTLSGFAVERNVYYKDPTRNFSFGGLVLADDTFRVILDVSVGELRVTVQCPKEGVQQRLTIGVYSGVADEARASDFLSVCLFDMGDDERFLCVRPENEDSGEDMAAAARLTVLTFGDRSSVYETICPVCGSTLVTAGDYCTVCSSCGAKYLPLKDGRTWINFFGNAASSYENISRKAE